MGGGVLGRANRSARTDQSRCGLPSDALRPRWLDPLSVDVIRHIAVHRPDWVIGLLSVRASLRLRLGAPATAVALRSGTPHRKAAPRGSGRRVSPAGFWGSAPCCALGPGRHRRDACATFFRPQQSPCGVVPHTARLHRGVRGDASPRRGLGQRPIPSPLASAYGRRRMRRMRMVRPADWHGSTRRRRMRPRQRGWAPRSRR